MVPAIKADHPQADAQGTRHRHAPDPLANLEASQQVRLRRCQALCRRIGGQDQRGSCTLG